MMIDGASTLSLLAPARFGTGVDPAIVAGRPAAMSDLRFFLTAYAGGFAFFLAILL